MTYNIPQNSPGVDIAGMMQQQNIKTQLDANFLKRAVATGGSSDLLSDRTPDVKGLLGSSRTIIEDQVHITNDTNTNTRAQAQLQFIELCTTISEQLGKKLSIVRTNSGIVDQTFTTWCQQQLSIIGSAANRTIQDGTYACASATPTVPPMNASALTPLPTGTGPTLDYTAGSFNTVNVRLSDSVMGIDSFDITHPGVEQLVRTLRVSLTGDVNNALDPTWAFATDLLNTSAVQNLSQAIITVGTLSQQAQDTTDEIKSQIPIIAQQLQTYGYHTQAQMIQEQAETTAMVQIQRSSIFSTLKQTQDFLQRMDQLY